jgi:very-short-patch-repair endonuclease
MDKLTWTLLGLFVLVVLVEALKAKARRMRLGSRRNPVLRAKRPMTKAEERMFLRLCETFRQPQYFVLAQVAFAALLDSPDRLRATRNTFDRKFADFVLCDGSLAVVAVIELDDPTHRGREREDEARASLLTNAGYRVVRYTRTPEISKLLEDFPSVP